MMGFDMEMEEFHDDEAIKKKQQEELQKALDEIMEEAKNVVKDYTKNPSEMSGSVTQVHQNSPYLATREERVKTIENLDQMFETKSIDNKEK